MTEDTYFSKATCTKAKDCAIYEMLIARAPAERTTVSSEATKLASHNVDLWRQLCPQIFLAW